jgi:hypothetical protein
VNIAVICGLFNDARSISDWNMSNGRITSKGQDGKIMKESHRRLTDARLPTGSDENR